MSWFKKAKTVEIPAPNGGAQICISDLLRSGTIKINMESLEKEEAIEELVDLLVRSGGVKDREAALRAIHARESMGSTGIGGGVAIPHGKDATIENLVGALGISRRGIEFDSADGQPARLVFLLLARSDNPGPHIQALSEIAQLVSAPKFLDKIFAARTEQEVLEIIRREEQE